MLQFGMGLKRSLSERRSARKWVRAGARAPACVCVRESASALPEVGTCIIMPLGVPCSPAISRFTGKRKQYMASSRIRRSAKKSPAALPSRTRYAGRRAVFLHFRRAFRGSTKIRGKCRSFAFAARRMRFANVISTLPTEDMALLYRQLMRVEKIVNCDTSRIGTRMIFRRYQKFSTLPIADSNNPFNSVVSLKVCYWPHYARSM